MNRRAFLSSLLTAATALTLDPESLLHVPGRKVFSIPAPAPVTDTVTFENGMSIRFIRNYDMKNGLYVSRLDVMYGLEAQDESMVCRVSA